MRHFYLPIGLLIAVLALSCGPAPAAQPAAKPAPPQQAAPAAAPQPAPQAAPQPPAKPAAEPAKPAAQPAKPQPEAKPAASAPGGKLRLLFGSAPTGTSVYIYSVAVAKLWSTKVPEVEVSNVATGGSLEHLRRMDRNELQAGPVTTDLAYQTWNGLEDFKDKPIKVQRLLYMYTVVPQGWMVRKDTNIAKVQDLDGKDFSGGAKGSASEKQTINVLSVLGVKPKYYAAGGEDQVQAVKDRRVVGFTKAHAGPRAIDASIQEVNVATPLRMLGFTPEQEKAVVEKFPYYSFMTVEKDQLARGMPEQTIRALVVAIGVAIHQDIPEDVGYKLAKATMEDNTPKGEQAQAAAYPAVKGEDFAQLTVDFASTPLHAGAVKYLREIGKQVKQQLLPPEVK